MLGARVAPLAVGALVQALGERMTSRGRRLETGDCRILGRQAGLLGRRVWRGLRDGRRRQVRGRRGREIVGISYRASGKVLLMLRRRRLGLGMWGGDGSGRYRVAAVGGVGGVGGGGRSRVVVFVVWPGGRPVRFGTGICVKQMAQRIGRHYWTPATADQPDATIRPC
jgi:hypothetical protein